MNNHNQVRPEGVRTKTAPGSADIAAQQPDAPAVIPPVEATTATKAAAESTETTIPTTGLEVPAAAEKTISPANDPTAQTAPDPAMEAAVPANAPAAPAEDVALASSTEEATNPAATEPPAIVASQPPTRAEIDADYVRKAADSSEYERQEHDVINLPSGIPVDVYAASRIGLGHIGKHMPCQDFCAYRKISHGVALLDADGVSACDQSQYGSRRACEIAADQIEQLSLRHTSEEDFVKELCSDAFYAGIRELWVADMKQHWLTLSNRKEKENPLVHYGTTLLIAVVTDHWYVTMNLGDGQILLFSEEECMRLQLIDKESQAPSCLVYNTYLEDVRRGIYPRECFQGIAIMTDGINDRLTKLPWHVPHDYIVQTAKRFTEHQAPYQPFIYSGVIAGEDRTYDISRQRSANDDFSIVMALCSDYVGDEATAINDEIRRKYPTAALHMLQRRLGNRAGYLVSDQTTLRFIIVSPENTPRLLRDPRLTHFRDGHVQLWAPDERWTKGGHVYAQYTLPTDTPSQFIEEAVQGFAFKTVDQYHKVPDMYDPQTNEQLRIVEPLAGEPIIRMHHTLTDLNAHLAAQSMRLNETAMHWILQLPEKNDKLLIPEEAIEEADQPACNCPWVYQTEKLAPAMFGYLACDGRLMPVFGHSVPRSIGYYYFFGAPKNSEPNNRFFAVAYNSKANAYGLMNISQYTWTLTLPDGKENEVAPGNTVGFSEGRRITVAPKELPAFTCTMHVL